MVIAVLVVNPTTRLSLNANEYLRSKPRLNQESPVSPRAPRRVQPPRHLAGGPSGEARRLESKVQSPSYGLLRPRLACRGGFGASRPAGRRRRAILVSRNPG